MASLNNTDLIAVGRGAATYKATFKELSDSLPHAVDATETAKGVVELATTVEAAAGTDTTRAVTPAGVKAASVWQRSGTDLEPATAGDVVPSEHVEFTQAGAGATARTVESKLQDVVSVKDFGAVGDGVTDDTAAIQAAIDAAAALASGNGGRATVFIPAARYIVQTALGQVEIGAHDDGTHPTAAPIAPETIDYQKRCLLLPSRVSLIAEPGAFFIGDGGLSTPTLNRPVCIALENSPTVESIVIENILFSDYIFGIASLKNNVVLSKFSNLRFQSCNFGIYLALAERNEFNNITAQTVDCLISAGGQWRSRQDTYLEEGGFMDKNNFTSIHNINDSTPVNTAIDTYFDTYFFKTANNSTRLVVGGGQATAFPYKGVAGRTVYFMARYSRPNNSNTFVNLSHHNSHRSAIWIDADNTCDAFSVYLEKIGWTDPETRTSPIGGTATDPYLGSGVRLQYLIKGCKAVGINAQFVYCNQITQRIGDPPLITGTSSVTDTQQYESVSVDLNVGGDVDVTGKITGATAGVTGAINLGSTGLAERLVATTGGTNTGIPVDQGIYGSAALLLCSRNTGTGTLTNSAIYLLNFPYSGGTAPTKTLVSGTDILNVGVSGGNLTLTGTTHPVRVQLVMT